MKNNISKFLFFSFLFFLSFYSFSQQEHISKKEPIIRVFDSSKVCDGYILWMGRSSQIMDRKGSILFNFPGNIVTFFDSKKEIASHIGRTLVVSNKDMEVLWKVPALIEHELIITPENNFMFFSKEDILINNVIVDFNNIKSVDSTRMKSLIWSSYEHREYLLDFMMKDTTIFRYKIKGSSEPDSVLFKIAPSLADCSRLKDTGEYRRVEFLHMNSIQFIPANKSEKKDTVFSKGNILLSFCNYGDSLRSFIAIVDPVKYDILWYYVQKDGRPIHTPLMLPNGHILVYINSDRRNPYSSVNEIDPITKKVVWEYNENFPNDQSRNVMGSCQRLPNGNTFISNHNGYIYEVSSDKKIIWQWYDDQMEGTKSNMVYRAMLYPKEKLNWFLNEK